MILDTSYEKANERAPFDSQRQNCMSNTLGVRKWLF